MPRFRRAEPSRSPLHSVSMLTLTATRTPSFSSGLNCYLFTASTAFVVQSRIEAALHAHICHRSVSFNDGGRQHSALVCSAKACSLTARVPYLGAQHGGCVSPLRASASPRSPTRGQCPWSVRCCPADRTSSVPGNAPVPARSRPPEIPGSSQPLLNLFTHLLHQQFRHFLPRWQCPPVPDRSSPRVPVYSRPAEGTPKHQLSAYVSKSERIPLGISSQGAAPQGYRVFLMSLACSTFQLGLY